MKVRKLAVALALAGGLGSGVAQALGLGEIELQSYLNEPLNAEIDLRKSTGVAPNDVFVNIAPQTAYDRVGIDRSYFLTKLNFQVITAPDGNLVVNVSSREPLREPYLNFLLEVTWPNGRLMREYAVLVDPPVYAEDSGVEEQVAAPTTQPTTTQPQVRQSAPSQPTRSTSTSTRSSGTRTLGPTNAADTLWNIAAQIRPNDSVSMQQTMLAIQDLNPDAFIDGNINRLKRGEILRIPDTEQIQSRTRADANREVAVQNRAFSSPQPTVDATASETSAGSSRSSESGGDQLRLVAAEDAGSRDTQDGGSAGGDSDLPGGVDAGQAVAMEQLESARRENEELTGRVDDLQDQVETLQRLLELKNSQLAEMQNAETESEMPADAAAADGELPVDEGADAEMAAEGESETDSQDESAMGSDGMTGEESVTGQPSDAEPGMEMPEATDGESTEAASDEALPDEAANDAEMTEGAQSPEPEMPAEQESPVKAAEAAPEPAKPAEKPFPGNIIDAISNNILYQVALGGGLIVLLLALLALARRNANREKAFYDQLNGESDEEADSFDLSFDEEDHGGAAKDDDAIAEADAYIAYGRNDQAAQVLETAISREPSRTDLRLKLLGVYAEVQDRSSFDKQFGEIEALDDEAALEEATALRANLEEAESMPSIDDLESQLLTGGSDASETEEAQQTQESDEIDFSADFAEPEQEAASEEESVDFSTDFEDMDLELPESDEQRSETAEADEEASDGSIEYDFSGFEDADTESVDLETGTDDGDAEAEANEDFDFSLDEESPDSAKADTEEDDLNIDFDTSDLGLEESDESGSTDAESLEESLEEDLSIDLPEEPAEEPKESEDVSADELDESFLDDLDAELDKVASDDAQAEESGAGELDDLELDVSDEDLALMEEFSESDDDTVEPDKTDDASLEDELGLEDALSGEEPASPEQEVEAAEKVDELPTEEAGQPAEEVSDTDDDTLPPVATPSGAGSSTSGADIDESDLGDDDDFDFLAGTDEAATKLDLARAYVEMGDVDGARDILEEVALEGNDEQKAEAQDLLKNLS